MTRLKAFKEELKNKVMESVADMNKK
jgi:hypothetical protein